MGRKAKLGNPLGVGQWKALENVGDVKRFLRWVILSVRSQTMDAKTAGVLGQLGCYLLRAIEGNDLEKRMEALERMAGGQNE